MMKRILCPLTVLLALPLGIAAHESRPQKTSNTGSADHNQHQERSTKGKQAQQDAEHAPDAVEKAGMVLELAIVGGTLGDEEQTVTVTEGEVVELRWTSDQQLTLHMHGYNLETEVSPNSPTVMRVRTTKTGRFPILNHDGQPPNVLLYLEVQPK